MLLDNQTVAEVPVLVPVTLTAMNLPLSAVANVRVVLVFPVSALQVLGTVAVAAVTALVQENH